MNWGPTVIYILYNLLGWCELAVSINGQARLGFQSEFRPSSHHADHLLKRLKIAIFVGNVIFFSGTLPLLIPLFVPSSHVQQAYQATTILHLASYTIICFSVALFFFINIPKSVRFIMTALNSESIKSDPTGFARLKAVKTKMEKGYAYGTIPFFLLGSIVGIELCWPFLFTKRSYSIPIQSTVSCGAQLTFGLVIYFTSIRARKLRLRRAQIP